MIDSKKLERIRKRRDEHLLAAAELYMETLKLVQKIDWLKESNEHRQASKLRASSNTLWERRNEAETKAIKYTRQYEDAQLQYKTEHEAIMEPML